MHREAVSAGMVSAAELAQRIGYLQEDFHHRQTALLDRLGLRVRVLKGPVKPLLGFMCRDKENLDRTMRFVLLQTADKVGLVSLVPEAEAAGVLEAPYELEGDQDHISLIALYYHQSSH